MLYMTGSDPLHTPRTNREQALHNLTIATEALKQAVIDVLNSGATEVDVARRAGIDRMTVRSWRRGETPQDVRHPALLLPEPKGHRCRACQHDTGLHSEVGCDVVRDDEVCPCEAPFGRIMPGDPDPISESEATR